MNYLVIFFMILFPLQAVACVGSQEAMERRFMQYDTNKDGYVDKAEWEAMDKTIKFSSFTGILEFQDKDGDGKLSKEEFSNIGFTKGGC